VSPNPAETEAVTPWLAELSATGRDLAEIAKPRITTMVVFTTAASWDIVRSKTCQP